MEVSISFKGDLAGLAAGEKGDGTYRVTIQGKRSVKDVIESVRIPHTEVSGIRVQDRPVEFGYILQGGDRVEVYPVREVEIDGEPAFLCDVHLNKLARRLRLLGFFVEINPDWEDDKLADISVRKGEFLLTRDRGLLMRRMVTRGMLIRSTDTEKQVLEVLERFGLKNRCRPFSRCLLCNGELKKISRDEGDFEWIRGSIPGKVLSWCREYNLCTLCGHIYWQGGHYKKLSLLVKKYLE